jgi:hypothetical protein
MAKSMLLTNVMKSTASKLQVFYVLQEYVTMLPL